MDNAGVVVYDNLSTTTFKVWLFCCWYINRTTVFVIEGLMNGVIPPAWHWYVDRITAVVADASVVVYDNLKSTTTFKMWLFCCWYINRITTFVTEELINGEIPSTLCCHANRLTTFVMEEVINGRIASYMLTVIDKALFFVARTVGFQVVFYIGTITIIACVVMMLVLIARALMFVLKEFLSIFGTADVIKDEEKNESSLVERKKTLTKWEKRKQTKARAAVLGQRDADMIANRKIRALDRSVTSFQDSEPYKECKELLDWLSKQMKARPFMQPVDPIHLKIPDYPDIVKNPMDISTVRMRLERGLYSQVGPKQTMVGTGSGAVTFIHADGSDAAVYFPRTSRKRAIARMLNGPFRADIELIFDNAALYNPPDHWIAKAAAVLKMSITKKIDAAIVSIA